MTFSLKIKHNVSVWQCFVKRKEIFNFILKQRKEINLILIDIKIKINKVNIKITRQSSTWEDLKKINYPMSCIKYKAKK